MLITIIVIYELGSTGGYQKYKGLPIQSTHNYVSYNVKDFMVRVWIYHRSRNTNLEVGNVFGKWVLMSILKICFLFGLDSDCKRHFEVIIL